MTGAALLASLFAPGPAFAQTTPPAAVGAQATPPAPAGAQAASPAAPPGASDEAKKTEARTHFNLGIAHFDRGAWGAALAEFLTSRALFPTRAATKDAAICLRKESRFDESLDMFEALLADYSDLAPADRDLAQKEIGELRASVATLEVRGAEAGAAVVVDGRARGTFPLAAPLRVSAGGHLVRVCKEGFLPFEAHVDLAGQQQAVVDAPLGALTQAGRLRVTEQGGRTLSVLVDDVVVGTTPWEGTLAVGDHVVVLRGEGDLGTQPVLANLAINRLSTLTLAAEELLATARINPSPAGATVTVDGVVVGDGIWEGRLRVGGHRVEVASPGFLTVARTVSLQKGARLVVPVALGRDPTSSLGVDQNRGRVMLELAGGPALVPVFGGDLVSGCTAACSAGFSLGFSAVLHGGYQLGNGLGLSLDAGYSQASESVKKRATAVKPTTMSLDQGTADDAVTLGGVLVGASASYHRGLVWPATLRLGIGALLGSAGDHRTGTFALPAGRMTSFPADVSSSSSATYVFLAPEARLGRRLGPHVEVSLGVQAMFLTALTQPIWDTKAIIQAPNPLKPTATVAAAFAADKVAGSALVVLVPGLGARYDF